MGTILCGVDDSSGAAGALVLARELSVQLEARLVIAHIAHGFEGLGDSLTGVQAREGAVRLLDKIARDSGLSPDIDRRAEVGEPAERLATIAAEEGADVIVVGSRRGGWRGAALVSNLARKLGATTTRPVVVVPPNSAG